MSESALTLKKVIPIIVVTWILSLVTTLAFVYVVMPNILRPTWHEVATLQSQDYEECRNAIFYIFSHPSSNLWRIRWSMNADSEESYFEFHVWGLPAVSYPDCEIQRLTGVGSGNGLEYFIGSGSFELGVFFHSDSVIWQIIAEAYY